MDFSTSASDRVEHLTNNNKAPDSDVPCKTASSDEKKILDFSDKNSEADSHSRSPLHSDTQQKSSDDEDSRRNCSQDNTGTLSLKLLYHLEEIYSYLLVIFLFDIRIEYINK